jgi:hypothetical protein
MDRQVVEWKLGVERLWSAATLDFREAVRLAADIARGSGDAALRQSAAQSLPGLRTASLENVDRSTRDEARRRLGVICDILLALDTTRFGRRGAAQKPLSPEERYRQMLGLPLGRRLARAEIRQAYKRAAKTAHPDVGGSAQDFLALSAAHEALMKERS